VLQEMTEPATGPSQRSVNALEVPLDESRPTTRAHESLPHAVRRRGIAPPIQSAWLVLGSVALLSCVTLSAGPASALSSAGASATGGGIRFAQFVPSSARST
jgi:hypothetical protein